jgi:hypothetical protein
MTDIDLNPIIKNLAIELTIATGELWTTRIDRSEWNQRPHADSPTTTLYFFQEWNKKNRLSIKASAPEGMREKTNGESISCDLTRTPQAIAQDIARRLLPHARAHLAESKAYDLKKRKEEARNNLINNLIMRYLPEKYNGKFFSKKKAGKYLSRIIAETTHDDLINIEINLPLKDALKLLKQLTKESP